MSSSLCFFFMEISVGFWGGYHSGDGSLSFQRFETDEYRFSLLSPVISDPRCSTPFY